MSLKERIALFFARREVLKRLRRWIEDSLHRPLTRKEHKMLGRIFGNWQTTLAGVFAAAVQSWMGGMSLKAVLASLPTLLIGMLAKDATTGSAPAVGGDK